MSKLVNFEFLTVLIIDDNAFMRRTLKKLLSGFGFKNILESDNAVDGLQALKQSSVDLILLDLVMDPINGIEFTKMVRTSSDTTNPVVPIILITGHTEKNRIAAARDAGVNEILAKRIKCNQCLMKLNEI